MSETLINWRQAVELQARPGCSEDVLFARDRALGHIVLNRPAALNALTHEMVSTITDQLHEWARDPQTAAVVLRGNGERGLCAGGDIRAMRASVIAGDGVAAQFWHDEYAMNAAIAHFGKPTVSIMDGIVMGGGIGFASFASLRLVTERTQAAMPETKIGFFPDVGALFLLARAPGELGAHLALTGDTTGAGDAIAAGFADLEVVDSEIDDLIEQLAAGGTLRFDGGRVTESSLSQLRWIDDCYGGNDPAAILARLAQHPDPQARAAAERISARSPISVAVTLAALRRAESQTLPEVLDDNCVVAAHFADEPDFVEGVRAQIIDKDRQPHWRHASVAEVDPAEVEAFFVAK